MSAMNPAGNAWLEKLELWLRDNQHPDIIYALVVAHRDGFISMVSNVEERWAKIVLADAIKKIDGGVEPVFQSTVEGK